MMKKLYNVLFINGCYQNKIKIVTLTEPPQFSGEKGKRLSKWPVHKIGEVPSWHFTSVPVAHIVHIILSVELHAHHSEDEDDDTQDHCQVGERGHCLHHNRENVVQTLPRLGQLEHSEKTEWSQHRETWDTLGQKFHQGQSHNHKIKTFPAILKLKILH